MMTLINNTPRKVIPIVFFTLASLPNPFFKPVALFQSQNVIAGIYSWNITVTFQFIIEELRPMEFGQGHTPGSVKLESQTYCFWFSSY